MFGKYNDIILYEEYVFITDKINIYFLYINCFIGKG